MFTSTAQEILEPIADTIVQLILLYSNAEIAKAPLPDLTEVAKAVDAQVNTLIQVGNESLTHKSCDDLLKKDMPKACKEGSSNTIAKIS